MSKTKIYKPKSCLNCVVCYRKGKKFYCGVQNTEIDLKDPEEPKKTWNNCPLDWDE